jgi:effector-binding domain-containing protein
MLDTPILLETQPRHVASIQLTIPRAEIRHVMGPGLLEIRTVLAAQDIPAAGPWLTYHRRMDPEIFDFQICVPVTRTVAGVGRVQPSQIPGVRVARTVYHGPYEGLGDAWGEFMDWIQQAGLRPGPDLWECYLTGPESGPDPKNWCTELNRPLLP